MFQHSKLSRCSNVQNIQNTPNVQIEFQSNLSSDTFHQQYFYPVCENWTFPVIWLWNIGQKVELSKKQQQALKKLNCEIAVVKLLWAVAYLLLERVPALLLKKSIIKLVGENELHQVFKAAFVWDICPYILI